MQETNCIGCKKSFQQGQTLPPEGIHIEYKNYYLPIKDHQPKWILIKTIIAFLNSKGGTIFMGVDDSTRQVIGVAAELKQQDMFMLQFDQLLGNIQPQVDLRVLQQVRVQFVPVLKDKTFQGKYIIKIIVKQGDPSKVYHFAQTLKFFNEDKKHHDQEFKVLWGFYRSNMGKVDAIKGTQLLRQVYQKAKKPSITVETFHPGCNPLPLQVSVRNMNIGFKNLKDIALKKKMLQFIERKLKTLSLQTSYSVEQTVDSDTIILKFKSITEYKQADSYILDHQRQLSDMIEGGDSLLDQGYIDNTHFYRIGQSFNPSLRYLRNRSRSRNRSIQIPQKKSYNKGYNGSPDQSNQHNNVKTTTKTRFIPKHADQKNQQSPQVKQINQFVKIKPQEEYEEQDENNEQQQQQIEDQLQIKKQSPKKKFQLKSEQFPQIGQLENKSVNKNGNSSPQNTKNKQKSPEAAVHVYAPKANKLLQMKQQSPIKQNQSINKKQNSKDKQAYHISITNIYQKSFAKITKYLEKSLGHPLDKIPHKIQAVPSNQEVVLHFPSLKQIQEFISELSKAVHHKQVLNNFGQGRHVHITVRKGSNVQDFKWIQDKQDRREQESQKKVKRQEIKQEQKIQENNNSPRKNSSPAQSFIQKAKIKQQDVKGCLFIISNVKIDLNDLQRKHLTELLKQIFKHFCSENAQVEIVNQETIKGVIQLKFASDEERKHFADLMQTQIIKYHEFTDFFKGHRAYWGVPSGNVIIHHYKSQSKKQFKEEVQKLFNENRQFSYISLKYVKDKSQKYYLNVAFHPNNLVKGLEILLQNIEKSPLKEYGSVKEGLVVQAQLNRI